MKFHIQFVSEFDFIKLAGLTAKTPEKWRMDVWQEQKCGILQVQITRTGKYKKFNFYKSYSCKTNMYGGVGRYLAQIGLNSRSTTITRTAEIVIYSTTVFYLRLCL